jgi:hypothetical protein
VTIKTNYDFPPIPVRHFDWSAIDSDTYDADFDYELGQYVSKCLMGHGATEAEAIADLLEQIEVSR